jgi:N-acetylglucosaminyldiphosphoundecaprenol N-acetyl-beta-D-mannosaminyltransferase
MTEARTVSVALAVENVLGFPVATLGRDECVEWVLGELMHGARRLFLACANPHSLVVAKDDEAFAAALSSADILIPDGVGMVVASRLRGGRIRTRVTGSDVFLGLSERLARERPPLRYFFLGSSEETLAAIERRLAERFPAIGVAGSYSPPFKASFDPRDEDAIVAAVNGARPDIVWVGMTAPKQEKLIARVRERLDVQLVAAVGAVFDFFSGRVTRSHPVWQRVGLEWLPRLMRQPRRLWRRTLISAPRFLWLVATAGRRGQEP